MNEQKLISAAESGDVDAMMTLAKFYDDKSNRGSNDQVGDVMTIEDFFKTLNAEKNVDADCEAKAYKYFRMAAEAGNAFAMREVGRRLYDGIGVDKNNDESKIWYKRAAEAGEPSAMRVTAFNATDAAEKFKWLKLSAELLPPGLNKQDSIKETAINYACGRGTDKDRAQAELWLAKLDADTAAYARMEIAKISGENFWLEQAAETSPEAMIRMAETFVSKNDFVNALTWYKRAAEHGSAEAMSFVGDIFYIGESGVNQDYTAAFEWYSRAAELDFNMAKIKRALMLYSGRGVAQDLQAAFEIFTEVFWSREKFFGPFRFNSVARYYAALMTERGEGREKNLVEAFERYKLAGAVELIAEHESPRAIPKAIYKVADAYFTGTGVTQDFNEALRLYEQTFTESDDESPYRREAAKKVSCMYEFGEGIAQDSIKAAEWRDKLNA